MTSFFAAYDALCEEGTATPVCKALNEVADISIPGNVLSAMCFYYLAWDFVGPHLVLF